MIGILVGMHEEVNAILEKLNNISARTVYNIRFWQGTLNNKPCVVALSGVGKVNSARCAQLLIQEFKPKELISIGSADALNPEIAIGDVVISTSCAYHDADITALGYPRGYLVGMPDRHILSDKMLIADCNIVMEEILQGKHRVFLGLIVTGDQVYKNHKKNLALFREFGAYCSDMESASISHVCTLCDVPFVAIRTIWAKPTDVNILEYYNFLKSTSKRCADFIEMYCTLY